jgi:MFS family permease
VSLFALPILLLARAGGRLADRAPRRRLVPAALLLVGACAASYPFLRPLAVILAVGVVEAVATVILEPSLFSVIGDSAPAHVRGHAMGVGGLSQFAGMAFGSGVLGSLYGFGEGLPFWVGAGILAAAALLCATALPERRAAGERVEPPPTLPLREREAV